MLSMSMQTAQLSIQTAVPLQGGQTSEGRFVGLPTG